ncbi:hypothetical protein COCNU_03G002630 [Cocos nucifera]|uniref:Uncharacterized protein n=1 Tax=Cocos nucifera TaxID=13894 RepID=A0A8K0I263_COCNU|nr:hypothetical protein COCNU_03G002630 [Cocos nucifera]
MGTLRKLLQRFDIKTSSHKAQQGTPGLSPRTLPKERYARSCGDYRFYFLLIYYRHSNLWSGCR